MLVEDEKEKELLELAFIPVTHFLCSIAISLSRLVPTPLQRHFERVGLAILCRIKGRTIDYFMVSPQIFLRLLVLPRIHLMQFSFILTTLRAATFNGRADTRTYACSTGTCSVCRYKQMFYSSTPLSSSLPLLACNWKQFFFPWLSFPGFVEAGRLRTVPLAMDLSKFPVFLSLSLTVTRMSRDLLASFFFSLSHKVSKGTRRLFCHWHWHNLSVLPCFTTQSHISSKKFERLAQKNTLPTKIR